MHAAPVPASPRETTPTADPIQTLVYGMREGDILRVFRRMTTPDRLERIAQWSQKTGWLDSRDRDKPWLRGPDTTDADFVRERFGCGLYVVRVFKARKSGQLVIKASIAVTVAKEHVS